MPSNSKIGRGYYVGIYSALIDNPGWQELSGNAALVFYTLKMSMRLEGIGVFYNDTRFQAQSRISADQIDEGLEELEEKGWIEREANILWVVHGLEVRSPPIQQQQAESGERPTVYRQPARA